MKPLTPEIQALNALKVVALTGHIALYIKEHDPRAWHQIQEALAVAGDVDGDRMEKDGRSKA